MKQTIIGTGLSGLVGTRLTDLLEDRFEFFDMSLTTGIDITSRESVMQHIKTSGAGWILHLAAKADVDGCETDKSQGIEGLAWKINVEGTRNVVDAAKEFNKRVLYISTDFVFDGTKEYYSETDIPNPMNWYGVTKYEGEKLVGQNPQNIILRIAYPYIAKCGGPKRDFVHTMYHLLEKKEKLTVLTDHIFTPTFVDDIARCIVALLAQNVGGTYHGVGGESLSPFEAAQLIAGQFSFDTKLISGIKVSEYYKNRAPRPLELRLKNDKIASLGIGMVTLHEGLKEIQKQGVR